MGNSFLDQPITQKKFHSQSHKNLRYTSCEMQGWRRFMEDAFIAKLQINNDNSQISLFAVFDGHGGAQVSKFVANHFLETLIKRKSFQEGKIGDALTETFINVELLLKSKSGKQQCIKYKKQYTKSQNITQKQLQSGTTAVVVVITKDKIVCANAGDSRAALYSGNEVIPLSFDHKPQNPIEKARIEKTGVPIIQGRVNGLNLTRSIGDFSHKVVAGLAYNKQPVICVPDIIEVNRKPQDKLLLIGCDGIWQRYGDDYTTLTTDFYNKVNSKKSSKEVLEQFFIKNIQDNLVGPYGKDNMTAIIVQFLPSEDTEKSQNNL